MNRMKSLSALLGSFFVMHGAAPASDAEGNRLEKIRKSKQYREGRFWNAIEFPMIEGSYMGMFKELIFGKQVRVPPSPLPQMSPDSLSFGEPPRDLQVVWLGHSTLLLEVEGKRFLIDPVLGSHAAPLPVFAKRFQAPLLTREQLPRIDAVLISHDHYDHLEKETMEFFAHKGIPIYAPIGVGGHLEKWGVDTGSIHELDWWEEAEFHGLRLLTPKLGQAVRPKENQVFCSRPGGNRGTPPRRLRP